MFPFCSALRLRCADVRVLAGFSAPLGHEQGERLIRGILEGRATFQNGSVPLGIDPELNDDAASFTLLCAQPRLTFPRLGRGIERGSFRTTGAAFLRRWN